MCCWCLLFCSRDPQNSTVVDRELTPWFLRSVDDLVLEDRNRFKEIPGMMDGF